MNKKGASFGTIVAMIGSILIFLGVAWLIAQNWHQIPAPIKIFILLLATVSAYSAGAMLRIKNYPGIGKALIVLGGLLYTLSIFLIAQIFFTRTGPQGIAWLLLIAWIGVIIVSYIFESSASLVVALIEFLIWIVVQFIAFSDAAGKPISFGILAFYFLFTGILVYGLSIIHRIKRHKFSSLYQFWTAFYFLAFTYILSFQVLLPMIWPKDATSSTPAIIFLFFIGFMSLLALIIGVLFTFHDGTVSDKELVGVIIIILVLGVLIGITSFTSNKMGDCYQKTCYDYQNDQAGCQAIRENLNCEWVQDSNNCVPQSCRGYKTQSDCENQDDNLKCHWENDRCNELECYNIKNQSVCEDAINQNCRWRNEECYEQFCHNFETLSECDNKEDTLNCKWSNNRCDEYDQCANYNDNYKGCVQQSSCKWRSTDSWFGRNKQIPLVVWAIWLIINVAFIPIILAIIGYGSWLKLPKIINLGIVFFALDIVTRYIGFIMDFWGYTSLSIIFITGGGILLVGGWLIEKWRRKLIKRAEEKSRD